MSYRFFFNHVKTCSSFSFTHMVQITKYFDRPTHRTWEEIAPAKRITWNQATRNHSNKYFVTAYRELYGDLLVGREKTRFSKLMHFYDFNGHTSCDFILNYLMHYIKHVGKCDVCNDYVISRYSKCFRSGWEEKTV